MKLSPAQRAEFHREGYLVVEDLLTDEDLQPVIDEINEEVDRRARELVASGDLSRPYEEEGFETRLTRITAETEKLYRGIYSGQLSGPGIFQLLTNPKLVDLAESLVGPEIIASSVYRLRPKVPRLPSGVVPWHQDSGYFEPACDDALVLTYWIPLVDATPERGCMQVIPRVHQGRVFRHTVQPVIPYLVIVPEEMPPVEPVTVPVRKGGVLLLTNRTPHCSIENVTDVIRWSMDLRYQSAALPTNYRTDDGHPFHDPPDATPVACYPPEADFLVRSQLRPWDVVTEWLRFNEIRKTYQSLPVTARWDH
ncbi:MAG: phytanoyl-CoA dioxygenase family protein [Candidatus Latescibacteria bacterium]|nr:phytanoyl-CoA dioxygenase family protein [Candidatus Latescibacterota bacterium]